MQTSAATLRQPNRRWTFGLIAAGLLVTLLAALALYWPGTHGPFLFDDYYYLAMLGLLDHPLSWRTVGQYLAELVGPSRRVLPMLSFLINDQAWPSSPFSFKYTNLLIHLLSGVMVFGLARSLAGVSKSPPRAGWTALATTAIWLLHPIQVSAIFLTAQRITLMSGLFVFAALWAYVALLKRARDLRGCLWAVLSLGVMLIPGVLSKENAVLGFLLAAVLNATVLAPLLARHSRNAVRLVHAATLLPMLLVVVAIVVVWPTFGDFSFRDFTAIERLMSEGRVLLQYVSQIFLPRFDGSGLYNDDFIVSRGLLSPPSTLLSALAIAALVTSAWVKRRTWPLYALAVLWFFAAHLIESTVISLELYFAHRNYVPLFGIAFALAAGAIGASGRLRNASRVVLAGWLAVCALISHQEARIFGDERLLSIIWATEHPNSLRAHQQLAAYYLRQGEILKARTVYVEGLAKGLAPVELGLQLLIFDCTQFGKVDRNLVDQLHGPLRNRLPLYGSTPHLIRDLRLTVQDGRCASTLDADGWLQLTDDALANPKKHVIEVNVRKERAYLFMERGNLDAAMAEVELAFAAKPSVPMTRYAAQALASAGRYDQALIWLDRGDKLPMSALQEFLTQRRQTSAELREAVLEMQSAAQ